MYIIVRLFIKYNEILYCSFDDYTNPTKVVVDYEAIMASLMEDLKPLRGLHIGCLQAPLFFWVLLGY